MGGRGAASGASKSGRKYGTEYTTVYQSGNIKFVVSNSGSNTAPMETMSSGRIYVTVDKNTNQPKFISFYDENNKRSKQIDLQHYHKIDGVPEKPHVHKGYEHNENGDFKLSETERKMVDSIMKTWYNNLGK